MDHQNFQEAIEQLSTNECMNPDEIKSKFNLSKEEMMAMKSDTALIQKVNASAPLCCCCFQSDN